MTHIGNKLAAVVLGLAVALVCYGTYRLLVTTSDPVVRLNRQLSVVNAAGTTDLVAGQAAYVRMDYCKTHPIQSEVGVFLLTDDLRVMYPMLAIISNLPTGCHVIDVAVSIPWVRDPGTYRLHMTRRYTHSILQPTTYMLVSEPFTVRAP